MRFIAIAIGDGRPPIRTTDSITVTSAEYAGPVVGELPDGYTARILAERQHKVLAGLSLACSRIRIEAVTAAGEEAERTWRHAG